ncbi:MAG: hypothetical protein ACLQF0_05365 [Dissulfurispiraceae bacterium]
MNKMRRPIESAVLVRHKRISALEPIFLQWININQEYCNTYVGEDCPYWYNERAAISILAGAVWKSGALALEEFNSNKKYKKSHYSGRADLWFAFDKKRQYLIEAKYDRFSLSSNSGKMLEKRIAENIDLAFHDAKKSKEDACLLLGVAFIVPYISPSAQANEKRMLADFYKLIRNMPNDFLTLYVNPHEMKDEEYGYSYPCIAIVGDVVS